MYCTLQKRTFFRRLLDAGGHGLVLLSIAIIFLSLRVAALVSYPFRRCKRVADILQYMVGKGLAALVAFFTFARLLRVTCTGSPIAPAPAVLIANHPSLIDALLLIPKLPRTACLFKAKLERLLFPRGLAENAGFISNAGGIESIRESVKRLQDGWRILVFPEGTRTPAPPMGKWKSSYAVIAARTGAPVQAVYISMNAPLFPKGAPWWRPAHFPILVHIRFGAPVPPPTETSVRGFHYELEASFRKELLSEVCSPRRSDD